MLRTEIIVLGTIALLMWSSIFWRAYSTSPLKWAHPTCIFSAGLFTFMIGPTLYWQFRPWTYSIPPYFEGAPLVMQGAILLGIPFLLMPFISKGKAQAQPGSMSYQEHFCINSTTLWLILLPLLIGIFWRMHLVGMGWQGRFPRDAPKVFGSESLALILMNFSYYYAICYFVLIRLGSRMQKQIGVLLWATDCLFMVYLLHRSAALHFLLRSGIFAVLMGWKITKKMFLSACLFIVFVIVVIGKSDQLAFDSIKGSKAYLSPLEVSRVLNESGKFFLSGESKSEGHNSSTEANAALAALDDTLFRLYDARQASAVMAAVPDIIPYAHGETFMHIFYALIPRYFWEDKPESADINLLTTWVMENDSGLNGITTIGEFYINGGFLIVFLGGFVCFFICDWIANIFIARKGSWYLAWISVYPFFAELFFRANSAFTHRFNEGLHAWVVLLLIWTFIKICSQRILIPISHVEDPVLQMANERK